MTAPRTVRVVVLPPRRKRTSNISLSARQTRDGGWEAGGFLSQLVDGGWVPADVVGQIDEKLRLRLEWVDDHGRQVILRPYGTNLWGLIRKPTQEERAAANALYRVENAAFQQQLRETRSAPK